jgi:peptidyl-prolyl cis-trans isomerase C
MTPPDAPSFPALAAAPAAPCGGGKFSRLLREPFVHFLVLGSLLFGLFALLDDEAPASGASIEIAAADVEQLRAMFAQRWNRPPGEPELQGLIEDRIREEVLYREALALGLDRNDSIVRRRLVQKLEFLVVDIGTPAEPEEAALRAYYERERESYREPARVSFTQVYFSPERRGQRAAEDAAAALKLLQAGPARLARACDHGDPSLLEAAHVDRGTDEIARDFGPAFAGGVDRLPAGAWQGPVQSAFGFHLVFVGARTESRLPVFEEVREQARRDFLAEQRRTTNEEAYARLRSRYAITIADAAGVQTAHGGER